MVRGSSARHVFGGRVPASCLVVECPPRVRWSSARHVFGGRVPARNERVYRDPRAGLDTGSLRIALLDQRWFGGRVPAMCSVVECPPCVRWSSAREERAGVSRPGCIETRVGSRYGLAPHRPTRPASLVGLDTGSLRIALLDQRWFGGRVPARNERVYRDRRETGVRSRYARWRSLLDQRTPTEVSIRSLALATRPTNTDRGLDTLAGARYSTGELGGSRYGLAAHRPTRPASLAGVSIRSLALATRPTNTDRGASGPRLTAAGNPGP